MTPRPSTAATAHAAREALDRHAIGARLVHAGYIVGPTPMGSDSWTPVIPFPGAGTRVTFVSGDPDDTRLRVEYFTRASDRALVARVWFGPGSEGPPGYVHGGAVAAALDEAMGAAAWLAGHVAVAARIVIDFREMVPLGLKGVIDTRVDTIDGRKVTVRARLVDGDRVLAEGEGLFVVLTADQIAQFARGHGSTRI
jgi:acyl-coenzyme A thioesterase PaaI-like protein